MWSRFREPSGGARLLAFVFATGLTAGATVLGVSGQVSAEGLDGRDVRVVSAKVNGDRATVVYKTNPKTTRPKTRICTLNGEATGCGRLTSSTRRVNTYTRIWTGLDDGDYRFRVTIDRARAAGGTQSHRIDFTVGCKVINARTGSALYGAGENLQAAIDGATAEDTLLVYGTCVGNYSIDKNLTLLGGDEQSVLDGSASGTVVTIDGGTSVDLDSLVITGGKTDGNGGGVYSAGGVSISNSTISNNNADGDGGGVYSAGGVSISNSTISNNHADGDGGGVTAGGPIYYSTISNNHAGGAGGGVYSLNEYQFVQYSTINGNTAGGPGGGILSGQVGVYSSTISDNYAANDGSSGGGIYARKVIVQNSTISDNRASFDGGGIYSDGGPLILDHSLVIGNEGTNGGGIYSDVGGVARLKVSKVTDNTATANGGGIFNNGGLLRMWGGTQVSGNAATAYGGGIYNTANGEVRLEGGSKVIDNAANNGGGIYNDTGVVSTCVGWTGAISPNTPDDPPTLTPSTCT